MYRSLKIINISLLSLTLSQCSVGPHFHSPSPPAINRYTESPTQETFKQGIGAQWWTVFQNESLNNLIKQGLENSPTIEAAQAALKQARANYAVKFGNALFPSVDLQVLGSREKDSSSIPGIPNPDPSLNPSSSPTTGSNIFNLLNLQFNLAYTLDFFGANRRALEALCAQVEYQAFQLEGTYLSLSTNIAQAAISSAGQSALLEATTLLLQSQERLLEIIKKQLALGAATRLAVLTQETLVAQTRASLPAFELNLAQQRHALYMLVGAFPADNFLPHFKLADISLPESLPLTLPSHLVRQRPDIRAQEALLHQASANIGVATANLFPQITLTGYYGWQSSALNTLFTSPNQIGNITAQLLQPVFHGGALRAQRRAALTAYEQAHALYQQTVLQAFQNVADVLTAIDQHRISLAYQEAAEQSAKKSLDLTEQQFTLGGASIINLLDAQQQYQTIVQNRLQAQIARLLDAVNLFQALGGGWLTLAQNVNHPGNKT